ncbi:PIN domain-containing protein [Candidatus Poriferisodalis sp.]|uniref:PIN domain-containing protein n=1 Tax=Candidatus Poriferisodalis sp. TaxID=3101277 RepID=UPI003B01E9CA
MRLVVDTNVLVGELLRVKGRGRLADERLELFIPEQMWEESQYEIPRRVARIGAKRGLSVHESSALTELALGAIEANVEKVPAVIYAAHEAEAISRTVRDRDDWPVVACAMALLADVWTNDKDFLGTGIATWTTQTLDGWLLRHT